MVGIQQKFRNLRNYFQYFRIYSAKFRENFIKIGAKFDENCFKIVKFCENFENLRKSLTIFCCDFRFRAVQKCDNLVDLGKCCKMSIYLQNFMPIQPRTSLLKFGHLAAKSGKSTVLYLSTKVQRR